MDWMTCIRHLIDESAERDLKKNVVTFLASWEELRKTFPSDAAIERWLDRPLPQFGGKTAGQLFKEQGSPSFQALVRDIAGWGIEKIDPPRRVRIRNRSRYMAERAERFRERMGIKLEDIGKPGFYFVDRLTGRSLMEQPKGESTCWIFRCATDMFRNLTSRRRGDKS